jgi:hypothetical protein
MFSQRNNPYCELLQNCTAIIHFFFNKNHVFFSKKGIEYFLYLEKIIQNDIYRLINTEYEENIRIRFRDK